LIDERIVNNIHILKLNILGCDTSQLLRIKGLFSASIDALVQDSEQRIHDEKDLIARSRQEVENLTAQLKIELIELSVLSQQIVSGKDKDDEAVSAEADRVRLEAIAAIDEFLQ
jgi:hypothetical protein